MDTVAKVNTSTGTLVGNYDKAKGQYTFFGIPYAEAPLGPLRFRPTVPKQPWEGERDATMFGAVGPQKFEPTEGEYSEFTDSPMPEGEQEWVGSEDNLTLNIWTPGLDNEKRPVMVWIHGGANWLEGSRLYTYHGDQLVARGDVVFVSINYRLGIFGFLDISVLGDSTYAGTHSTGLRDQITALRWVKQNIEQFGGDANNITVMGESAGSIDISWLLTNGLLDGIAKRVIMMSGVAGLLGFSGDLRSGFNESYAQDRARDFLSRMEVVSTSDLEQMPTEDVMRRLLKVVGSTDMLSYMDSMFWPRTSNGFTPQDPLRAAADRGSGGIDVMIGYTGYEMGLWLFWDETLDQHPTEWAANKILDFADSTKKQTAATFYDRVFSHEPAGVPGMHMMGDSIFVIPSLWFADMVSKKGHAVWMYQFDRQSNPRQRALHAADQVFLFDKLETQTAKSLLGAPEHVQEIALRKQLTESMQDAVIAFARFGDPNTHTNRSLPHWPQYEMDNRAVMSFDIEQTIKHDPAKERREWWYQQVYRPSLG